MSKQKQKKIGKIFLGISTLFWLIKMLMLFQKKKDKRLSWIKKFETFGFSIFLKEKKNIPNKRKTKKCFLINNTPNQLKEKKHSPHKHTHTHTQTKQTFFFFKAKKKKHTAAVAAALIENDEMKCEKSKEGAQIELACNNQKKTKKKTTSFSGVSREVVGEGYTYKLYGGFSFLLSLIESKKEEGIDREVPVFFFSLSKKERNDAKKTHCK